MMSAHASASNPAIVATLECIVVQNRFEKGSSLGFFAGAFADAAGGGTAD